MKIADFDKIKIGSTVLYEGKPVLVTDIQRREHLAKLHTIPGSKWVRCSEFSETTEKAHFQVKKRAKERLEQKGPFEFVAINTHLRDIKVFNSVRDCAAHFGTTDYYIRKMMANETKLNGYMIFNKTIENMTIKELKEAIQKDRVSLMDAMNKGKMRNISHFQKEIEYMEAVLKEKEAFVKNGGNDPNVRSFIAKTLSLAVNEADLSIHHLDIFFAFYKAVGYTRKDEWQKVYDNLIKALEEYGEFARKFLVGYNRELNLEDVCRVHGLILDNYYTKTERPHYDHFEDLAGEG